MPAGQILLRGRGPNTSEALLLGGIKSETMPKYATPFIDEALRAEVQCLG
jgi:hypothetical protein